MNNLISVSELSDHLHRYRVIDATWFMPTAGRNAHDEYLLQHIPGAVFFDIDAIADRQTDLPHMLPSVDEFARAVSAMGISNSDSVVVYDAHGIFSSPRVWWTFKIFGHEKVSVLNGGLPAWKEAGKLVASGETKVMPTNYKVQKNAGLVVTMSEVEQAIKSGIKVLDARSAARFNGKEPEPRQGVSSGHIPGSMNIPYKRLISADDINMKSAAELQETFAANSVTLGDKIITCCGSGITACILALGLELAGYKNWSVYDGSWAEWGSRKSAN